MVKYGKSRFRISGIGFSLQILVKCGLSATIAFAGREVFFAIWLQFWNTSFLLIW
jgi:hypothetical protein